MQPTVPNPFLDTIISSPKIVDIIVNYHLKQRLKIDKMLDLAYLISIKAPNLRIYYKEKRRWVNEEINKREAAKNIKNNNLRHKLWCELKNLGVVLDEYGEIINTILNNDQKGTCLANTYSGWKCYRGRYIKNHYFYYIIFVQDKRLVIRNNTTITYEEQNWKIRKRKKHKPKSFQNPNDRSPYTVYNSPARIIYTPMGGQNKHR